jgi:hypothetical protein
MTVRELIEKLHCLGEADQDKEVMTTSDDGHGSFPVEEIHIGAKRVFLN